MRHPLWHHIYMVRLSCGHIKQYSWSEILHEGPATTPLRCGLFLQTKWCSEGTWPCGRGNGGSSVPLLTHPQHCKLANVLANCRPRGVEMTYCTPYLLNLGLTKSQTSVVWIAGPLSGIITQPIVGVLADSNKSKWGRRRPYIFIGTIIVSASLLLLGWTREIVAWLLPVDSDFRRKFTIFLAVLALYVTDFAINAGMWRFALSALPVPC